MRAFYQLVLANIKEFSRDKMELFWFIIFPVVFVTIFGIIYSGLGNSANDKTASAGGSSIRFNVGLVNEANGPLSDSIIKSFNAVPEFIVHTGPRNDELKEYKSGRYAIVVILPKELSNAKENNQKVNIPVYYNINSAALLYAVSEIINGAERDITGRPRLMEITLNNESGSSGGSEDASQKSKGLNQIDYVLPGILAMTLMQLGMFSSLRILSMRSQKILKSLGATPLPRGLFLTSEIFVRMIMALVQALVIVIIGHLVFGLTLAGNWANVILWILMGVLAFVSIGYMLTTFTKTVDGGNGLLQAVQFPMMFLSGVFVQPEMLPGFIRPVMRIIPLTYLADGMRNVMTGSSSLYGITIDFAVLAGFILLSLFVNITRFRWE